MDLKRGIEKAVQVVVEDIKAQARAVSGTEEIGQVGEVAANGETEIGTQIGAPSFERPICLSFSW